MFKLRWVKLAIGGGVLIMLAVMTTDRFNIFEVRRLKSQVTQLQRQKAEMQLYATRLSTTHRTAQINVLSQHPQSNGETTTVLRWQQIAPSGVLGPPEIIEVKGTQIYIEAMVIKFDYDLIGRAKPGRETSLAMFRRAFGDQQAPRTGTPLDQTLPPDEIAQHDPDSLQARLWKRFWDLSQDAHMASEWGVRVAQCEAPSVRVRPGEIWEVRLDAAGGLNLRKIASRPLLNTVRDVDDSGIKGTRSLSIAR